LSRRIFDRYVRVWEDAMVTRYGAEAAEALRAPYDSGKILTYLIYDPVIREWDLPYFRGSADAKIWGLKICEWLQYKYPNGPAW
jgi:hypothetical protein